MIRSPLRTLLVSAAAFALVAGAALAQTPMDDPLDARDAKRVDRMEKVVRELRDIVFKAQKTGAPVVVQPADTDSRLLDISTRVGDLEKTLTRINASMEATAHDLEITKRENRLLSDQARLLSEKLAAAEQKIAQLQAPPPPPPPPPEEVTPARTPTANEMFGHAKELQTAGDFDAAVAAWEAFLGQFGDSARAPEARYQLAKTLTAKGAHARAAAAYLAALRGWPQATWGGDATVELARSLVRLNKPEDACQALAELTKRYPKAPAAVVARAKATATQAKCS